MRLSFLHTYCICVKNVPTHVFRKPEQKSRGLRSAGLVSDMLNPGWFQSWMSLRVYDFVLQCGRQMWNPSSSLHNNQYAPQLGELLVWWHRDLSKQSAVSRRVLLVVDEKVPVYFMTGEKNAFSYLGSANLLLSKTPQGGSVNNENAKQRLPRTNFNTDGVICIPLQRAIN